MRLTILYFAELRDAVGMSEESIDADVATVGALAAVLAERHRAVADRLASIRFARNEAFTKPDEPLAEGDVVALLPPVAGG